MNGIRCKDCLLSVWDVAKDNRIFFSCQMNIAPDKTMAVRTAEKFTVTQCGEAREGQRHGGGPGTWSVFEIAAGKHLADPPVTVRSGIGDRDPLSELHKINEKIEARKRDQRHLGDFFEGGKTTAEVEGCQ